MHCPLSVQCTPRMQYMNRTCSVAQHGALKLTAKRNKLTLAVRFAKINPFINAHMIHVRYGDVFRLGAVTSAVIHKAF